MSNPVGTEKLDQFTTDKPAHHVIHHLINVSFISNETAKRERDTEKKISPLSNAQKHDTVLLNPPLLQPQSAAL